MLDSEPQKIETANAKTELHIPFVTIIKVLLVLLVLQVVKLLFPLMVTFFLAVMLSVLLAPIVRWLESKRLRKSIAIGLIVTCIGVFTAAVFSFVVPRLFTEFSNFITNIPKLRQQLMDTAGADNPLKNIIADNIPKQGVPSKFTELAPIYNAGNSVFEGFTEIVLIFVFAIYLLVDEQRTTNWICAFFSRPTQIKIRQSQREIAPIIFSYVLGQVTTSFICFVYVLVGLSAMHVPNALLLAVLAGIFDILPVLGFFLAAIPALLFASAISGETALIVLLMYIAYHAIENYFIIPAIYGKRLRLSSFVVLVSLIAAWTLLGIKGAIAILPIVASYPIMERIWLRRFLGPATIHDHEI